MYPESCLELWRDRESCCPDEAGKRGLEVGKLLSIKTGKPELSKLRPLQAEPARAIYYGVFFRDHDGMPQLATDSFYAERKCAERFIALHALCKAEGTKTDCFIATLSVPVSAAEKGECLAGSDRRVSRTNARARQGTADCGQQSSRRKRVE
jgi:hypothetical protein